MEPRKRPVPTCTVSCIIPVSADFAHAGLTTLTYRHFTHHTQIHYIWLRLTTYKEMTFSAEILTA